ncbi:hypothetical protein ACH5RR_011681 [Cinchona calisaya]|uniref:non-specific serine/threonine protein kinase n=1 Tax=Cinchona calisaya TaxID=153742 RepID=A0ABD3A977_9GENT
MHQKDQVFLILSQVSIILILILSPAPVYAYDERYETCNQSFYCSDLESLGYPFWGGSRPQYCGHPGFELDCDGNRFNSIFYPLPRIQILSMTYTIQKIDTTSQILTIAREDLANDTCPKDLHNTTIDLNLFNPVSTDGNLLYLFYGCAVNSTRRILNSFVCRGERTNTTNFFTTKQAFTGLFTVCKTFITVPIDQTTTTGVNITTSASVVNLSEALGAGFSLRWMANNTVCDLCTKSGGLCGSIPNSTTFACYCSDRPYAFTCNDDQPGEGTGNPDRIKLVLGLSLGIPGMAILSMATFCLYKRARSYYYKMKERGKNERVEAFFKKYRSLTPKQYRYSEIKRITNSFVEKLGQGGYGSVYKGKLADGSLVAVKILSETKGNGEEFINEVASISRTSHVHIVTLLGFCYTRDKKALIYEFMPNGSLDKFICQKGSSDPKCLLDWNTLYKIAVGIAQGLEYLHGGCNTRIVHFDIKPHNILLDKNFCPKISDFGLAKLGERTQSIMSMLDARGTIGYIAPEVFCGNFGSVSHKSDVYSYGMMVLEMVGLRRKVFEVDSEQTSEKYFPFYIYEYLELGKDLELRDVMSTEEEEITRKMILVGLWCIQTNPADRPRMSKVVEMLEGSLQSMKIPPKPFLYNPAAEKSAEEPWMSSSQ